MQSGQTAKKEEDECLVSELLQNMATELSAVASSCGQVQWIISSLLERAHHPDMPAELHMLQDIDRLQQTLEDIASLLEATTGQTGYPVIEKEELSASLKLDSLRTRLFPRDNPVMEEPDDADAASDITWL